MAGLLSFVVVVAVECAVYLKGKKKGIHTTPFKKRIEMNSDRFFPIKSIA